MIGQPATRTPELSFRWDFVTDPPTKLLAELETARSRFRRRQYREAASAARRLLRHVDDKLPYGLSDLNRPGRLAVIRADGRAVQALALHRLGSAGAAEAVSACVEGYQGLIDAGWELRPPSLADHGMVLAVSGRLTEAVAPLVRAAEAGEKVVPDIVRDTARRLLNQGAPSEALRLLRALHERYPDDPRVARDQAAACEAMRDATEAADAHVAAGALYAGLGRHDVALCHFERAVELVPVHPLAALGRCQTLLATGQLAHALDELTELARTQPDLAGTHAVRALALARSGQPDQALDAVEQALTRFADDPWLLDTRIRLLHGRGDSAAALAAVEHALQVDPTDRAWQGLRAQLLLESGKDVEEAIQSLRGLASSAPESASAAAQLAAALAGQDRLAEALDVVIRALAEHPDEPGLVAAEVSLLGELGRPHEAVRHARDAVHRGVPLSLLALPLAEAELRDGDVAGALHTTGTAVEAMPDSVAAHRLRGIVLAEAGQVPASVDELRRAWSMGARDDRTRQSLARGLVELAQSAPDRQRSTTWLGEALALRPDDLTARHLMADVLREGGDYAAALKHVERGLEVNPDDPPLLTSRGMIQDALGHQDLAEQDYRRAIARDPDLASARAELGELLRTTGRFREALEHLQVAARAAQQSAWVIASKGATEYSLEMYDEAIDSLGRALEWDSNYAWARAVRASVLADIDRFADARADVEAALEEQPSMGWCWSLAGWLALHEDGATADNAEAGSRAEEAFRHALAAGSDSGATLAALGEALAVQGRDNESRDAFRQSVVALERQDPLDATDQATLGWALLRVEEYDGAVNAFLTALSLDSAVTAASFELALALLCAGRVDVGLDEFKQAAARASSIHHEGRRQAVLHQAARDLEALASGPMRGVPTEVDAARGILARLRRSDAPVHTGGVQVPTA